MKLFSLQGLAHPQILDLDILMNLCLWGMRKEHSIQKEKKKKSRAILP